MVYVLWIIGWSCCYVVLLFVVLVFLCDCFLFTLVEFYAEIWASMTVPSETLLPNPEPLSP